MVIWFVMLVATCVAGMFTMATLNNRPDVTMMPEVTKTTAATTPISNTTSVSIYATTTATTTTLTTKTTAQPNVAMLFLSTFNPRNWFDLIRTSDARFVF